MARHDHRRCDTVPSGGALIDAREGNAAWYVVRTNHHADRLASAQLRQRGFATFLPLVRRWPRPAVGSPVQPLFPGYLFVRATLPADFGRIAWTPGVKAFVTFGDAPAPVDAAAVDYLQSRADADGIMRDASNADACVRITSGPFRGLAAVVERRIPARNRVLVLLELLQRTTRVELSPHHLVSS